MGQPVCELVVPAVASGEPQDISLVYDAGQSLTGFVWGCAMAPISSKAFPSRARDHIASRAEFSIVIPAGSASRRLELWSCKKGSLKPLRRLKVNQARKIKEAHYRHRGKSASKLERPPPSRVVDGDLRHDDLRLNIGRRGSLEQQTEGPTAHPNESYGEADAKDNFQDVKFLLATEE